MQLRREEEADADLVPVWAVQSQGGMNRWGAPYDWNPVFDEVLAKMIAGELDAAGALAAASQPPNVDFIPVSLQLGAKDRPVRERLS